MACEPPSANLTVPLSVYVAPGLRAPPLSVECRTLWPRRNVLATTCQFLAGLPLTPTWTSTGGRQVAGPVTVTRLLLTVLEAVTSVPGSRIGVANSLSPDAGVWIDQTAQPLPRRVVVSW